MVLITRLVGSASLFIVAFARPRPDSAINEPAVAAPNGTPTTLTENVTSTTVAAPLKTNWYNDYKSSDTNKTGDKKEDVLQPKDSGATAIPKPKADDGYKTGDKKKDVWQPKEATATPKAKADSYDGYKTVDKKKDAPQTKDPGSTATPKPKADSYDGYKTGDKKKVEWKPKDTGFNKPPAPTYGSGKSDWNQGYDDCVQQCQAKYKLPPAKYTPTATQSSSATGATHTVIVAPTQGVLRYVPFAVNAAVGDTVKFRWGANNHTVTKGSALLPCNKTLDSPFSSGTQNKDFEFDLRINDTQPIYFYCGTPTHCQKGMFAMINPPSNPNASTSVANMMTSVAANYSGISTYATYTSSLTENKEHAAKWGSNIDMGSLPEWSHQYVAENVLYTRSFLGMNSETLKNDSSVDLSSMHTTPLVLPKDVNTALTLPDNSTSTPVSTTPSNSTSSAATTSSSPPALSGSLKSGGIGLSSSTILVTVVAFASFLL